MPNGAVAVNGNAIAGCGKLAIKISGAHAKLAIFGPTTRGFFYHGKGLWQNNEQFFFDAIVDGFDHLINLIVEFLFFFEGRVEVCGLGLKRGKFLF